jgi:dATP pyrophosphohydrolase
MGRAPINALVFPYRKKGNDFEFAIFNRSDSIDDFWQGISGGAEDSETPLEAARRESWEEGRVPTTANFSMLDSRATIPASTFRGTDWADDVYVVHEFTFAVDAADHEIVLSHEHTEYRWVSLEEAREKLKHLSNRSALTELGLRLQHGNLRQTHSPR